MQPRPHRAWTESELLGFDSFTVKLFCVLGSGQNPVSPRCRVHGGFTGSHRDSLEEHSQKHGEQQGGQRLHSRQVRLCAPRVPEGVPGETGTLGAGEMTFVQRERGAPPSSSLCSLAPARQDSWPHVPVSATPRTQRNVGAECSGRPFQWSMTLFQNPV